MAPMLSSLLVISVTAQLIVGILAQSLDCTFQGDSYQFCLFDQLGDFDIYWDNDDPISATHFVFDVPDNGDWHALGFSSQRDITTRDVMTGTNCVVGCADFVDGPNAVSPNLVDFHLGARAVSAILAEGRQSLMEHSEVRADGRCTVKFTRPFAPEDVDVNQHLLDELRTVVLATGPGDATAFRQHGAGDDDRTFFEVNFATGTATAPVSIPIDPVLAAHGALMAIAFGLMFPGGILAAHHKKILFGDKMLGNLMWWFQVHRVMMPIGAVLSTTSFILILVHKAGAYSASLHFILGIVVIVMIYSQFSFVKLRPKGAKAGEALSKERRRWNLAHWWNGRTTATLALVNCFVGFNILEPPVGYLIFFVIVVVLILGTYVGLEIFKLVRKGGSAEANAKSISTEMINKSGEAGGQDTTANTTDDGGTLAIA